MRALYLDSSAFVKIAVEEPESAALRTLLAGGPTRRVASALLRTEAIRAVRHLGAEALAAVREGIRRVDLVAVDDQILDLAGLLGPRSPRTLDAIHLATALALGDDLAAVVSYRRPDARRRTPARGGHVVATDLRTTRPTPESADALSLLDEEGKEKNAWKCPPA